MALLDSSTALFLAFTLPKIVTKLGVSFLVSCPIGYPIECSHPSRSSKSSAI